MDPVELRRAFRARAGTKDSLRFAGFLEGLAASESSWRRLVALLERDVVSVVSRCHPEFERDEISSLCFGSAFETWIPGWLEASHVAGRVRFLLLEQRHGEAWAELAKHPRFRGRRAEEAGALWSQDRWHDATIRVEGSASARSTFIKQARAQIGELQRKQRRQSSLMDRHCTASLGVPASGGRSGVVSASARAICGAELDRGSREHPAWLVSALPPAHLPSQDLAERLRRMLSAIDELGPEHARVFKLLLQGLSQRSIAEVEGRHPAAISRRVRSLQELCRVQLLE